MGTLEIRGLPKGASEMTVRALDAYADPDVPVDTRRVQVVERALAAPLSPLERGLAVMVPEPSGAARIPARENRQAHDTG